MQCMGFGRWNSQPSWRTSLLSVVQWRGVGVYFFGISVWPGKPYLRRRRERLYLHCLRDSLLAYCLKIPLAKILALPNTSCFRSGDRLTAVGKTKHVIVKSLYCKEQVTLPLLYYHCLWPAPVHSFIWVSPFRGLFQWCSSVAPDCRRQWGCLTS
jgi:hypothetical protein